MPKRRFLFGVLIGAGSFAGRSSTGAAARRSRTRVDLYFDDGSMMSLGNGSPDADALLPIATELLTEAGDRAGSRGAGPPARRARLPRG